MACKNTTSVRNVSTDLYANGTRNITAPLLRRVSVGYPTTLRKTNEQECSGAASRRSLLPAIMVCGLSTRSNSKLYDPSYPGPSADDAEVPIHGTCRSGVIVYPPLCTSTVPATWAQTAVFHLLVLSSGLIGLGIVRYKSALKWFRKIRIDRNAMSDGHCYDKKRCLIGWYLRAQLRVVS